MQRRARQRPRQMEQPVHASASDAHTTALPVEQWKRLSFSGDPEGEASVASALAEAGATGDRSLRPWMEGDPPLRTIAVGPGLVALRARRSPEETALTREVSQ